MYEKLREIGYKTISNKFNRELQNVVTFSMRSSSIMENEKVHSVMYLWTASVEDMNTNKHILFCGRTWDQFKDFINELIVCAKLEGANTFDDPVIREFMAHNTKKRTNIRIYDHNLEQDFQFLRNCYSDEEFGKSKHVFAREIHKPMYAWITKDNVAIRFVNSSRLRPGLLSDWAKDECLPISKQQEEADITIKTPATKLTTKEIAYSFNDNCIIAYGIQKYRNRYSTIENIPLTQAGIVRRECKATVSKAWINNCKKVMLSYDFETYKDLCRIFIGGSIHSNKSFRHHVLENIASHDLGSGYAGILATRKFPVSPWEYAEDDKDPNYFYYYKLKFTNVKCKLNNTFWPIAKITDSVSLMHDDQNLQSAKSIITFMTDIDLEIFKQVYKFSSVEILKCKKSKAGYLPVALVKLILQHYAGKTNLKGIKERLSEYNYEKVLVNCFYGVFVTRNITDDVYFDENGWQVDELTEKKFIQKRDEEAQKDIFTIYQIGPWVTAYCRQLIWTAIIALDKKVVYFDTDCVKGFFNKKDEQVFNDINKSIYDMILAAANHYGINPEDYYPKYKPIGMFEKEHTAIEFKTIGSKRYAALYETGIETVLSGLSKEAGAKKIHEVDDLTDDLQWDEKESGRYTFYYIEGNNNYIWKDRDGNKYENDEPFGMAKIPSTFEFGVKSDVKILKSAACGGRPSAYFDKTKIFRDL